MAKKDSSSSLTWRDIVNATRHPDSLAPVYLLMGEEPYYLDLVTEAFERNVIPEEDKDFNFLSLYGAETDIESVVSGAQQYPFMADRRLVILKEAQAMDRAKTQLDRLEGYVAHPNPGTVLVVVYKGDNLNATSRLMKVASKSGAVIFKSAKVKDYQLGGPIRDYCQQKKVGIDDGAAELLAAYLGNSLEKLFGEIDKLIIAGGPGLTRINAAMVQENIGISKEFNNFELVRSIGRRDYPQTMRIVDYFARNARNNPTAMTVATLFNYFCRICIAHFNHDKSDMGLTGVLQLKNPSALREVKDGMRVFNPTQCVKIISAIREMDTRSKGIDSTQNEYDLLRELIFRIFTC